MDLAQPRSAPMYAAQYVRMSTEHQKYSAEAQRLAIGEYASRHGYAIVQSYDDLARSGLTINKRAALQRLIGDVEAGVAAFKAVLVYDVSRWGRFQDTDESAYYEYICRRNGTAVLYCAETFENDGRPMSAIIKGVKRAMAAEYSRELSKKVYVAQAMNVERGFRSGGPASFALSRVSVDGARRPKTPLAPGERKGFSTDRVVLVPGKPKDVDIIRRMFEAFAYGPETVQDIAARLNADGVKTTAGLPWRADGVRLTLTNEIYAGTNVWNHSTSKLRRRQVRNPPELWLRAEGAFEPVVSRELFDATQGAFRALSENHSKETLLHKLRLFTQAHPRFTRTELDAAPEMPWSNTYRTRFGSLAYAMALIGAKQRLDREAIDTGRAMRRVRTAVLMDIAKRLAGAGATVRRRRATLLISGELELSVMVLRSAETELKGLPAWASAGRPERSSDLVVAARMRRGNAAIRDYYLLPPGDAFNMARDKSDLSSPVFEAFRHESLAALPGLMERATP